MSECKQKRGKLRLLQLVQTPSPKTSMNESIKECKKINIQDFTLHLLSNNIISATLRWRQTPLFHLHEYLRMGYKMSFSSPIPPGHPPPSCGRNIVGADQVPFVRSHNRNVKAMRPTNKTFLQLQKQHFKLWIMCTQNTILIFNQLWNCAHRNIRYHQQHLIIHKNLQHRGKKVQEFPLD